jgi:hypothetical protein
VGVGHRVSLGHSLHDTALVNALKTLVEPGPRIAVSVFSPSVPSQELGPESRAVCDKAESELNATVVPMRFGEPMEHAADVIKQWLNHELPD